MTKGIGPNKLGVSKAPVKQTTKAKAFESKIAPTRNDSIVSAYHHNKLYHKDKYYNPDENTRAKEVAKKFPELDKYMQKKENRAKIGQDYK
tara:strand:- start:40 stop:312 length:273 start_codon:yes stop_codon:yes gene_type:complete